MSIKTKIITTVVCICCIVSAMVVGILAASQQTFNISGTTVSFTSNQIAFKLDYAISGNFDSDGNMVMPEEYTTLDIGTDATLNDWVIGDLNFGSDGDPIYIEINVSLSETEVSQSVITKLKEDSAIFSEAKSENARIKVSYFEDYQTYNTEGNYSTYLNNYKTMIDDNDSRAWTDIKTSNTTPKGLDGKIVSGVEQAINDKETSLGKYTLIFKIEPANKNLNFSEVDIDFSLDFSGQGEKETQN